jgi:hypothetical protein
MIVGGMPRTEFDVVLAGGRSVSMERIVLGYTYGDVLEGDPSRSPPDSWLQSAADAAIYHFYPPGMATRGCGVAVLEPTLRNTPPFPSRPHVPYVQVLAWCTSWHNGTGTALALVWFQDSLDEPLLERFTTAVRSVDWDACAIAWSD